MQKYKPKYRKGSYNTRLTGRLNYYQGVLEKLHGWPLDLIAEQKHTITIGPRKLTAKDKKYLQTNYPLTYAGLSGLEEKIKLLRKTNNKKEIYGGYEKFFPDYKSQKKQIIAERKSLATDKKLSELAKDAACLLHMLAGCNYRWLGVKFDASKDSATFYVPTSEYVNALTGQPVHVNDIRVWVRRNQASVKEINESSVAGQKSDGSSQNGALEGAAQAVYMPQAPANHDGIMEFYAAMMMFALQHKGEKSIPYLAIFIVRECLDIFQLDEKKSRKKYKLDEPLQSLGLKNIRLASHKMRKYITDHQEEILNLKNKIDEDGMQDTDLKVIRSMVACIKEIINVCIKVPSDNHAILALASCMEELRDEIYENFPVLKKPSMPRPKRSASMATSGNKGPAKRDVSPNQ